MYVTGEQAIVITLGMLTLFAVVMAVISAIQDAQMAQRKLHPRPHK